MVSFLALEACQLEIEPQDPLPLDHLADPTPVAYNIDIQAQLVASGHTTPISATNAK